ncbi:MAG TPA: molybdopterin cofactor-binding domain-containing protein, partial [Gaiellaceae bacterium]|nr:molybdopterin cofactor-binding domain-containing protein [Gaiellaceae bacterium]
CLWEGDTLVVHVSTQFLWGVREEVAEAFELPQDRVRVVCEYMGGGFGAKNGASGYIFLAAELARRARRPVRCALNRREENVVSGNRNATIQRVVAGARADGTLTALGGEYLCALGWGGWLPSTAGPMQLLYSCENVRTTEYGAKLNLPPMAAFRAPGFVEGTWSLECLLDKLAAALDLDPLELRRRNYAHADTMNSRPYSAKNLAECYRRAEPAWERRHEVRARSDERWKRGVGLASQIWYGGGGPPSYAWVRVGGRIVSSDGGSWPLEEVTAILQDGQILGKGARGPNPTGMRVLTFGVQVAEVAVDVETGEVRVERITAIHDVGRVINPLGARSQIEGGIVQALGHTFSEVRLDDPQTGRVLTKTLDAYKLPTIADVPEIVCEFVDEPDAHLTNLGAKGLGEPPIIPTAAAIANAIRDATGADVRSLPITREELLAALARARERLGGGTVAARQS